MAFLNQLINPATFSITLNKDYDLQVIGSLRVIIIAITRVVRMISKVSTINMIFADVLLNSNDTYHHVCVGCILLQ